MLLAWDELCPAYSADGTGKKAVLKWLCSFPGPRGSSAMTNWKLHGDTRAGLTFSVNPRFELIFSFPCILPELLNTN